MVAKPQLGVAGVILGIPLALTGCAVPVADDPVPTTSQPTTAPSPTSPDPSPEPTPDSTGEHVAIPPCDELVPLDLVQAQYGTDVETFHGQPEMQEQARTHIFGPEAVAALDGAEQVVHCGWGIPNSDALSQVYVAELDPAARDTLTAALDDSVFERSEEGGWIRYSQTGEGGIASLHINYFFRDRIWVSELGSQEGALAREALGSL